MRQFLFEWTRPQLQRADGQRDMERHGIRRWFDADWNVDAGHAGGTDTAGPTQLHARQRGDGHGQPANDHDAAAGSNPPGAKRNRVPAGIHCELLGWHIMEAVAHAGAVGWRTRILDS